MTKTKLFQDKPHEAMQAGGRGGWVRFVSAQAANRSMSTLVYGLFGTLVTGEKHEDPGRGFGGVHEGRGRQLQVGQGGQRRDG